MSTYAQALTALWQRTRLMSAALDDVDKAIGRFAEVSGGPSAPYPEPWPTGGPAHDPINEAPEPPPTPPPVPPQPQSEEEFSLTRAIEAVRRKRDARERVG
ncbi:hypothetical protein SAMN04488061_2848 [Filomicrobium insigne]|uniref:Uncharacterized protein n=1 Tax=Filomicrobium insigne TaxID=418854 RepID=A0A1H0SD68_9HYPH|nr:hypothetical protein [Filomicrobium insigne]SDP39751.1 hypothetical protein SAMN04488061_2848 [Filomicrobium insigne]